MTEKTRNCFFISSLISVFVMAVAVLFGSGKVSLKPFGVRGSLSEPINGSITWTRENSEQTYHSYNKYSFYRSTVRGTGIYLYSYGAGSPGVSGTKLWSSSATSSNSYGLFVSAEKGKDDALFEFQSITSVTFVTASTSDANAAFNIYDGGTDTTPVDTKTITSAGQTIVFTPTSPLTRLSVNTTLNGKWVEFTSITINYSCDPSVVPSEKTLSSISVSDETTEFTVGDEFSFGGTVTAHYTDGSSANVTSSATFSDYDMNEKGDQTVTVSYTEGLITKTTTYGITVVGAESDYLDCTFKIVPSTLNEYKFDFRDDGTGRYYRVYDSGSPTWIINFTYSYNKGTGGISFELNHNTTYSVVNNYSNNYRLVPANSSGLQSYINDSGFINSSGNFEIDLYRVDSGVFSTRHHTYTLVK